MLQVSIVPIKPEKEARLRQWLVELNKRADEVRQTFCDESVRGEQGFIIPTAEGPLLVYAIETESLEKGRKVYLASTREIDHQHKAVMKECLGESLHLEPIYNVFVK